jgi:AmmeMemoRadiSam system protein B
VVIAAPLHYFPEYGIVLPTASSFQIPTGPLPVDRKSIQKLAFHADTLFSEEAHAYEHSIETQLPFLREIWGGIPIVPLGFADISTDVLSRILDSFLSDPETLLLMTSDFSHYFDYDRAKAIDNQTFDQILTGHPIDILHSCGAIGINALGKLARSHSLSFHLLDARNSGDITGSKSQVTGYGAFALSDETHSRK